MIGGRGVSATAGPRVLDSSGAEIATEIDTIQVGNNLGGDVDVEAAVRWPPNPEQVAKRESRP